MYIADGIYCQVQSKLSLYIPCSHLFLLHIRLILDAVRPGGTVALLAAIFRVPPAILLSVAIPVALSELAQLGVDLLEGVAGYDLSKHHKVGLMGLPVGAEQPAELVPLLAGPGLRLPSRVVGRGRRPCSVAVDADDKAALATGPVVVEQGRLANVAHLADALDDSLPSHGEVLVEVDGGRLLLLLELVKGLLDM